MGVVCIFTHKVPEGKSGQQTVDLLQKRIEDIGAVKTGNFLVECESYQAVQTSTTQKTVHIIHNSETPATCYAITDSGVCLSADILFDAVMVKLRDFYSAKKNLRVESKGQRYEIGDFVIKIGSVVIGQNTSFKGILVEVEYLACEMPNECWNLMKEFMTGFMGSNMDSPTSHFTKRMENLYMPVDTAQQYLEHFNNFRKATSMQPQR